MTPPLLYGACWPNIVYAQHVFNGPATWIEQHDTYARQTYRNRYEILSANGRLALTVPVLYAGNRTPLTEIRISYSEQWQHKHWGAITSAYRNSAFFEYFEDGLRPFYSERTERLLDYNLRQLRWLMTALRMPGQIHLTGHFEKDPSGFIDLRKLAVPRNNQMPSVSMQPYPQVFGDRFGFVSNLSVLDLLFNLGLGARDHLTQITG